MPRRHGRSRVTTQGTLADVVLGATAGAAGAWLMGRATTWLLDLQTERTRRQEDEARGHRTAYETAAERAAHALHVPLPEARREQAASALHWATGIGAGVLYALLRRRWPRTAVAGGLPFGTAVFLALDEGLNSALGLTPGPAAFPWQTHARGLGGHLVFGGTAEAVLAMADRLRGRRRRGGLPTDRERTR